MPSELWFFLITGLFGLVASILDTCGILVLQKRRVCFDTLSACISSCSKDPYGPLRAALTPSRTSAHLPSISTAWGKPCQQFPPNPPLPACSCGCSFHSVLHWASNLTWVKPEEDRNNLVVRALPWAPGVTAPFPWDLLLYLPLTFRKAAIAGSRPGPTPAQPEKYGPDLLLVFLYSMWQQCWASQRLEENRGEVSKKTWGPVLNSLSGLQGNLTLDPNL